MVHRNKENFIPRINKNKSAERTIPANIEYKANFCEWLPLAVIKVYHAICVKRPPKLRIINS